MPSAMKGFIHFFRGGSIGGIWNKIPILKLVTMLLTQGTVSVVFYYWWGDNIPPILVAWSCAVYLENISRDVIYIFLSFITHTSTVVYICAFYLFLIFSVYIVYKLYCLWDHIVYVVWSSMFLCFVLIVVVVYVMFLELYLYYADVYKYQK